MYEEVISLIERNKVEAGRIKPYNRESTEIFTRDVIGFKPIKIAKLRGRMGLTFDVQDDEFLESYIILRATGHDFEYKVGNFSNEGREFRGVIVYVPYGGREVFRGGFKGNE